jgi:hypothetical protein
MKNNRRGLKGREEDTGQILCSLCDLCGFMFRLKSLEVWFQTHQSTSCLKLRGLLELVKQFGLEVCRNFRLRLASSFNIQMFPPPKE